MNSILTCAIQANNSMDIKQQVDAALNEAELPNEMRNLLIILKGDIRITHDLQYDGVNTLTDVYGQTHEIPLNVDKGRVFKKSNGDPYASDSTLQSKINRTLQSYFKTKDISMSTIQRVYSKVVEKKSKVEDCPYIIPSTNLQKVSIEDFQFDDNIYDIVKEYDIYVEKDKTDKYQYPFFKITIPNNTEYVIRYDIYRYVAKLPYYNRLNANYRLPTVDHISHDIKNNSREALRYCTITQNSFNKCRKGNNITEYHGVTKDDYISIISTTEEEKQTQNRIIVWMNIIGNENLRTNDEYERQYAEEYFDQEGKSCKAHKYNAEFSKYSNYMNDIIYELNTYILKEKYHYNIVKDGQKNKISKSEICISCKLLTEMYDKYPGDTIIVNKYIRPKQLCVIASDLIKISMHGSFAHLNILKNPITPQNLEDALGFAMKQSPEEILNIYEYYSDVHQHIIPFTQEEGTNKCTYKKMNRNIESIIVHTSSMIEPKQKIEQKEIDERTYIIEKDYMAYYSPKVYK